MASRPSITHTNKKKSGSRANIRRSVRPVLLSVDKTGCERATTRKWMRARHSRVDILASSSSWKKGNWILYVYRERLESCFFLSFLVGRDEEMKCTRKSEKKRVWLSGRPAGKKGTTAHFELDNALPLAPAPNTRLLIAMPCTADAKYTVTHDSLCYLSPQNSTLLVELQAAAAVSFGSCQVGRLRCNRVQRRWRKGHRHTRLMWGDRLPQLPIMVQWTDESPVNWNKRDTTHLCRIKKTIVGEIWI